MDDRPTAANGSIRAVSTKEELINVCIHIIDEKRQSWSTLSFPRVKIETLPAIAHLLHSSKKSLPIETSSYFGK